MELLILIITLAILTETTIFLLKNHANYLLPSGSKRKIYVDSSVLMDVRLIPVMRTGFIDANLIIPRSVTRELQLLADGKDSEKRLRARMALDAVRELERVQEVDVTLLNDALDRTPVDERLLQLAHENRGSILTNDFNLSKVAQIEQIPILSLNELAITLRNQYLPGEHARIKINSVGSAPQQGVGYLPDGTMVVIDHASDQVGKEIEVEFIRLNQTAAGTMLFAKKVLSSTRPRPALSAVNRTSRSKKRRLNSHN